MDLRIFLGFIFIILPMPENTYYNPRNDEVIASSREAAIVRLNTYPIEVGKTVYIKYYADLNKTCIDALVAIGITNGTGPGTYSIISDKGIALVTKIVLELPDVTELVHGQLYLYHDPATNLNYYVYLKTMTRIITLVKESVMLVTAETGKLWWVETNLLKDLTNFYTKEEIDAMDFNKNTYNYNYNIKKTYESVSLMQSDSSSPVGTDGIAIQIGDIVTVVNSTTPSENGIYSYEGATDGWKYQSSFNFQLVQTTGTDVNSAMSQKAVTTELDSVRSDLGQLADEVVEAINEVVSNKMEFELVWNDNKLLTSNGGITDISEGTFQYGRCSATDKIDCSDYQGKTIVITHGAVAGDKTRFIFYNGNAALSDTYTEYDGSGRASVVVPNNATSFVVGLYITLNGALADSKAAASVAYFVPKFVNKSDIADNLTINDASKVLSAKQGFILNNNQNELSEEIDNIGNALGITSETVNFGLTWDDNKLLRSNGSITNIDSGSYYNKCATTDAVPCSDYAGKLLTLNYGIDVTYFCFYNGNNMIGSEYNTYSGSGSVNLIIPYNATSFRIGINSVTLNKLTECKSAISASCTYTQNDIPNKKKCFSQQLFGAMDYALPTDFDYAQLLFFGQSFAQGGSSRVVDTGVIPNCYMYGETVKTLIAGKTFNPLQLKTDTNEPYEFPVAICANALSKMYRRYGMDVNILASTGGTSGTSIQTLLDSYISNQSSMNENIKIAADAENKTVGCFAIVYMQGESDYGGRDNSTPDKDEYKAKLLTMKNTLQGLAMSKFGQEKKPLFFIYQTSGSWVRNYEGIDNTELGVSMAQIEFAAENDDVILVSPAYQVTTYTDSHPSTNGYRWLGEYYAKAIWQTLYRGFRYSNPRPMEFVRRSNKIIIYLSGCILPLQLNTWTLPRQDGYGFKVVADNVVIPIESITFENNAVIISLYSSIIDATNVSISYGGVGVGKGNVCDSDNWSTWTKYLTDTGDTGYDGNRVISQSPTKQGGGSIVGENYPMNNFLSIFYKEL